LKVAGKVNASKIFIGEADGGGSGGGSNHNTLAFKGIVCLVLVVQKDAALVEQAGLVQGFTDGRNPVLPLGMPRAAGIDVTRRAVEHQSGPKRTARQPCVGNR